MLPPKFEIVDLTPPKRPPLLLMNSKSFEELVASGLIKRVDKDTGTIAESVSGVLGLGPGVPFGTEVKIITDAMLTNSIPDREVVGIKDIALELCRPYKFKSRKILR